MLSQLVSSMYEAVRMILPDARTCGPNVFHLGKAIDNMGCSETHHRWGNGILYDNVEAPIAIQVGRGFIGGYYLIQVVGPPMDGLWPRYSRAIRPLVVIYFRMVWCQLCTLELPWQDHCAVSPDCLECCRWCQGYSFETPCCSLIC